MSTGPGPGLSVPESKVTMFCFCRGLPWGQAWEAGASGSNHWGYWVRVGDTHLQQA